LTQSDELVAAVQVLMQLAELGDQLQAAQERFDYGAIGALAEKNRELRPRLAQCLEGLKTITPQTPQEQELVALAVPLVKKIRRGDKAFAIWQENLNAMRAWSVDGAAQSLLNVPRLCDLPPVDVLDGRFEGVPAVIVAAGPSLDKNFHLLHELADRAVIITMNRCATIFEREGIAPHFVVTSERSGEIPDVHFDGVSSETVQNLVLRPSVHPRMLDVPTQRTFLFTDGSSHEAGLMDAMGKSSRPVGGGTVGHSCFLLAFHLGCDPIVLIGQDLAYGDGKSYSSMDVDADTRLVLDGDGKGAVRRPDGSAKKFGTGYDFEMQTTAAWGGGEVPTSIGFLHFIDFYDVMVEAMMNEKPLTLVNATEGGAHLEGMEEITLREAIDRHITHPIEGLRQRILLAHANYDPPVSSVEMAETIRELGRQMVRLRNLTIDGEKLAGGGKRNPRRLQRLTELQQRIQALLSTHDFFLKDAYRGKLSMVTPSDGIWETKHAELRALRTAVDELLPGCRAAIAALDRSSGH
jgi:hypothetical protein